MIAAERAWLKWESSNSLYYAVSPEPSTSFCVQTSGSSQRIPVTDRIDANREYREMRHQLPGNETPNYRNLKHLIPGNETRLRRDPPGNETLFDGLNARHHWRIRRVYLCIVLTNYNNTVVVSKGLA